MIRSHRGFTLIELAVVVFIISLLLGSLLIPLSIQVEQKQIGDTQKTLDEIKEALLGFAVANGYLPCPDTDNDGLENTAGGVCTTIVSNVASGNLPWQTLGVASTDVWGNRFRYVIREEYARRSPSTAFTLSTVSANVRVCSTAACATTLTSSAIAAILSYGKNGYGATNSQNGGVNPAPTSADELENTDTDRDIVSRIPTTANTTAGEFDDIVTWLPLYTLFNRMVAAGKLP